MVRIKKEEEKGKGRVSVSGIKEDRQTKESYKEGDKPLSL
jgi:hypothetical protein